MQRILHCGLVMIADQVCLDSGRRRALVTPSRGMQYVVDNTHLGPVTLYRKSPPWNPLHGAHSAR
jgi:hypothetical protein